MTTAKKTSQLLAFRFPKSVEEIDAKRKELAVVMRNRGEAQLVGLGEEDMGHLSRCSPVTLKSIEYLVSYPDDFALTVEGEITDFFEDHWTVEEKAYTALEIIANAEVGGEIVFYDKSMDTDPVEE